MLIEDKIKEMLKRQLDVIKIENNALLDSDLNADSLDKVELVMALEEEFDISISDEDAEKILTVSDLIDYIKIKVSAKEKK